MSWQYEYLHCGCRLHNTSHSTYRVPVSQTTFFTHLFTLGTNLCGTNLNKRHGNTFFIKSKFWTNVPHSTMQYDSCCYVTKLRKKQSRSTLYILLRPAQEDKTEWSLRYIPLYPTNFRVWFDGKCLWGWVYDIANL